MNLCRWKPRPALDSGGFSLIELLTVTVVLGVIMAIAVPALLKALDKSRQKRTMADLRLLGGIIEEYAVDNSTYPVGTSIADLSVLIPDYANDLISVDAWHHDLIYTGSTTDYTLGSAGKDGGNTVVMVGNGGPTQRFDDDIIFRLGNFVQWPGGPQD